METDVERGVDGLRTVVIGLDGSDASAAALDWVGRSIERDGVVHAVHAMPSRHESTQPDADARLSSWTRELRARGIDVRPITATGSPVDAIVEAGRSVDADVVVVGAHASGSIGPRLVGRTVKALIHCSDRPIVVVPEGVSSEAGRQSTIVAGVGRGAATRAALRWATSFAEANHTPLSLVRAVERRPFFDINGLLDVIAYYIEPGTVQQWALADVADLADTIQQSTDEDLAIAWSAPSGPAGTRLVEAASDAALLVVGRRESTGEGHHLPRYLQHTIRHAPCPVVVVPTSPGDDREE